jgi:hypothetical protein
MSDEGVVELLDAAVEAARAAGRDCSGWTMQSDEDGYVAWLYREDDDGQHSLFDSVFVQITALSAAQWVLTEVTRSEA